MDGELNMICIYSISGFIDYIVLPTLTVLGDGIDLILSTLDIPAQRPLTGTKVHEEGEEKGSRKVLMHRPWNDSLMENREKWQKKHDSGK